MFCDDTRDAIKGSSLEIWEPGFVNGAQKMEEQILRSVCAWCGDGEDHVKAPSQVITYVSSHDNQTLWDKLCQTTKDEALRKREYRLAAGIYIDMSGESFLSVGGRICPHKRWDRRQLQCSYRDQPAGLEKSLGRRRDW